MAAFENRQGITKISFKFDLRNFCPLGDDWYVNHITAEFRPLHTIPDYVFLEDEIRELDGKSLIIEDVVNNIYNILDGYGVGSLRVVSYVNDAKHMPVTVEKVMEDV